jgi:hypothetical protein
MVKISKGKNVERRWMREEKERYYCSVMIKTFYLTVRIITTIFSRTSSSYHILILHPHPHPSVEKNLGKEIC